MTTWGVICTIGLATYGLRASMFVLLGGRELSGWLDRPMAVIAPAAIAALVGAMVLTSGGRIDPLATPQLVAIVAAFVAVRRSGNVMHAFTAGLPAMWIVAALV